MSDDEFVRFGCMRCKRTRAAEKVDEVAEKTMLFLFEAFFGQLEGEAQKMGLEVPETARDALYRWGVEQSILPDPKVSAIAERNKLD